MYKKNMNKKLIHNGCCSFWGHRLDGIFTRHCLRRIAGRVAAVLLCVLYVSCSDPIFHQIEAEVKPKEPKIEGSPSKIAAGDSGNLYAANGNIWKWDGASWSKEGSPAKSIRDVAWAGGVLYALSVDNITTKLFRRNDGGAWAQVRNASSYGFLQAVYGAGNQLYVSARQDNNFHVLVYDTADNELKATGFHAQIFGAAAANGNFYFAAKGTVDGASKSAVFKFAVDDVNLGAQSHIANSIDKGDWVGIAAGTVRGVETVAAVSRTGYVCIAAGGTEHVEKKENSYSYTGAVGFWNSEDLNYLLIGIRGSSYTNGYRELEIKSDGGLDSWGYGSPGISVESLEKYNSTLGVHALTAIVQAPGGQVNGAGKPLLFASTQQNGLWSYRGVWNAEE